MKCQINQINLTSISSIKTLWEKLNKNHLTDSHYFKEYYKNFTFKKRCEKFTELAANHIFIEGVFCLGSNIPVGYCISTVENEKGEINSLFIKEQYRKSGYGTQLVEQSINWLKKKRCTTMHVVVAEGHESVFGFYQQFCFYTRMTYPQFKEK